MDDVSEPSLLCGTGAVCHLLVLTDAWPFPGQVCAFLHGGRIWVEPASGWTGVGLCAPKARLDNRSPAHSDQAGGRGIWSWVALLIVPMPSFLAAPRVLVVRKSPRLENPVQHRQQFQPHGQHVSGYSPGFQAWEQPGSGSFVPLQLLRQRCAAAGTVDRSRTSQHPGCLAADSVASCLYFSDLGS